MYCYYLGQVTYQMQELMPARTIKANALQQVLEFHLSWNRILFQNAVWHYYMRGNASHTSLHATNVDLVHQNKGQFDNDYFPLFLLSDKDRGFTVISSISFIKIIALYILSAIPNLNVVSCRTESIYSRQDVFPTLQVRKQLCQLN